MKRGMLFFVVAALASTGAIAGTDGPRYIGQQPSAFSTVPFSPAVFVGDTLYVAGHLGLDPKTGRAPEQPEIEAKLLMDAVEATLKSAGLTMDSLVSVTVYTTDLGLYDTFNGVYKKYFHEKYPARAFVGASQLLRGAHFEIQGIAVRSGAPH